MPELLDECGNALFQNIIAEHNAYRSAVSEVLRQSERGGDSSFAFLVCVIEMTQPKFRPVTQKFEKISRMIAARHNQDVADTGADQRLYRIVDHRLIINRK